MVCAIWYHMYNFKNVKNNHVGVLLLVKLLVSKLKLYKWYQIAQRITYKSLIYSLCILFFRRSIYFVIWLYKTF